MNCEQAQEYIMLHYENRLKPMEIVALHGHLKKCNNCSMLFSAMDDLQIQDIENIELSEPPADFQAEVMAKVAKLPPYKKPAEIPANWLHWGRIATGIYSLALVALILVINMTEWIPVNDFVAPNVSLWAENFFLTLSYAGQTVNAFLVENLVNFSPYILAITLILGFAATFLFQKDRLFANFSKLSKADKKV